MFGIIFLADQVRKLYSRYPIGHAVKEQEKVNSVSCLARSLTAYNCFSEDLSDFIDCV